MMGGTCSRDGGAENPCRKVLSENVRRGDVLGDILVLNLDLYYDFTQHQYKF